MKFSTRQDTELAAEQLFNVVSDFDRIERIMLRRGAEVRRIDPAREPRAGMAWQIGFDWRGKRRELRLDVTRFDRPELIQLEGLSDMFEVSIDVAIIALTRNKSRMTLTVDLRPRSMRARLLLQTAKLGKGQLDRKFQSRVAEFLGYMTQYSAAA